MLTKKNIIAIFRKNFFLQNLVSLLNDEGLKVEKKKLKEINFKVSNKIFLVDIDSKKTFQEIISLKKKNLKNSTIFALVKDNLKINDDSFSVINPPIIFEEFLKQVKKILEKKDDDSDFLKIGRFSLNYHADELTDNLQNNVIRLTELESKFLKFLYNRKTGSTKLELLTNVWGHSTELDTHTLESLIYRVRKKIEINPNCPKILILKNKKYYLQNN